MANPNLEIFGAAASADRVSALPLELPPPLLEETVLVSQGFLLLLWVLRRLQLTVVSQASRLPPSGLPFPPPTSLLGTLLKKLIPASLLGWCSLMLGSIANTKQ